MAPRSPQEHDTAGLLKEMQYPADVSLSSPPDPFLDSSSNQPGTHSGGGGGGHGSSRYQATAKRGAPPRGIFDDI